LPQYAHGRASSAWRTMIASQSAQDTNRPVRVREWTRNAARRFVPNQILGFLPSTSFAS
jgi:hypothetical protein